MHLPEGWPHCCMSFPSAYEALKLLSVARMSSLACVVPVRLRGIETARVREKGRHEDESFPSAYEALKPVLVQPEPALEAGRSRPPTRH